jgi:hypothetical protein
MKCSKASLAWILCAVLASGGEVGLKVAGAAPQKSRVVPDLRATRKGDKVTLTWTQPQAGAHRPSWAANLMVAQVCRTLSPTALTPATVSYTPTACAQSVGLVDFRKPDQPGVRLIHARNRKVVTVQLIDTLPAIQDHAHALEYAVYRVEFQDTRGRRTGFSNATSVPLAPILPAKGLHSELDVRGVYLIWENEMENQYPSIKIEYMIYRSENGSANRVAIPYLRGVIHTREGERWSAVDTNIEWEKTYSYSVKPLTRVYAQDGKLMAEIEGNESATIEVRTHNVFAPAAPEKLFTLVTQSHEEKFVDLLWAPNAEKDISGYNVYRRDENGEPARIHSVPMTMLSFQDKNVEAARTYFYSISAVDMQGNESARSQEARAILR